MIALFLVFTILFTSTIGYYKRAEANAFVFTGSTTTIAFVVGSVLAGTYAFANLDDLVWAVSEVIGALDDATVALIETTTVIGEKTATFVEEVAVKITQTFSKIQGEKDYEEEEWITPSFNGFPVFQNGVAWDITKLYSSSLMRYALPSNTFELDGSLISVEVRGANVRPVITIDGKDAVLSSDNTLAGGTKVYTSWSTNGVKVNASDVFVIPYVNSYSTKGSIGLAVLYKVSNGVKYFGRISFNNDYATLSVVSPGVEWYDPSEFVGSETITTPLPPSGQIDNNFLAGYVGATGSTIKNPLLDATGTQIGNKTETETPPSDVITPPTDYDKGLIDIFIGLLADLLNKLLQSLLNGIDVIIQGLQSLLEGYFTVIENLIQSLSDGISTWVEVFGDILARTQTIISDGFDTVVDTLSDLIGGIGTTLGGIASSISPWVEVMGDLFTTATGTIVEGVGTALDVALSPFEALISGISSILTSIVDTIGGFFDWFKNIWNSLLEGLKSLVGNFNFPRIDLFMLYCILITYRIVMLLISFYNYSFNLYSASTFAGNPEYLPSHIRQVVDFLHNLKPGNSAYIDTGSGSMNVNNIGWVQTMASGGINLDLSFIDFINIIATFFIVIKIIKIIRGTVNNSEQLYNEYMADKGRLELEEARTLLSREDFKQYKLNIDRERFNAKYGLSKKTNKDKSGGTE